MNLERNATSKVSQGSLIFTVDVVVHHFDIGIWCISLECTLGFKQNNKPCLQDQTLLRPNQSGTTLYLFKYIKREKQVYKKSILINFYRVNIEIEPKISINCYSWIDRSIISRLSYKNISKYILCSFYFVDQRKRKYNVMTTDICERSITWNK